MRNEVHLITFWYRLCENAWFPWQHPYMVFENGGRPSNSYPLAPMKKCPGGGGGG